METIKTKAYGEIRVEEDTVITFKREILGFEDNREYYLIEMGDLPNFYWLQSRANADLAFIVVDPRIFKADYRLQIDESDLSLLETKPGEEPRLVDFAIVNIPDDVNKMTMNLLGPIVINSDKRVAIQAISMNDDYGTKVPVFTMETATAAV